MFLLNLLTVERTPLFTLDYNVNFRKKVKQSIMKQSRNRFRSFGFLSIGLCALCCALLIIGMTAGIGALTILSKYFEWAGILALVSAAVAFSYVFIRKRKAPACD